MTTSTEALIMGVRTLVTLPFVVLAVVIHFRFYVYLWPRASWLEVTWVRRAASLAVLIVVVVVNVVLERLPWS